MRMSEQLPLVLIVALSKMCCPVGIGDVKQSSLMPSLKSIAGKKCNSFVMLLLLSNSYVVCFIVWVSVIFQLENVGILIERLK